MGQVIYFSQSNVMAYHLGHEDTILIYFNIEFINKFPIAKICQLFSLDKFQMHKIDQLFSLDKFQIAKIYHLFALDKFQMCKITRL